MKTIDKIIDGFFEVFFSEDKTKLYLLIFLGMGLVLRIIAAVNLSVSADDMVFAVHSIGFLGSNKLEVYDQSTSLWYSLTDSFYRLFGIGQLTSRLAAVLFGTFSILLVYLLSKEVFKSKKIGLIAAFLLAVSPFYMKNCVAEMDVTITFFLMLAFYLVIKASKEKIYIIPSAISFGLAVLTKSYSVLFIPGYFIYAWYLFKKNNFDSKKIRNTLIILGIVIFIFVIPTLTYNYLLYQDKGIMDFQFSRTFRNILPGFDKNATQELYGWNAGWNARNDIAGFFFGDSIHIGGSNMPSALYSFLFLLFTDPVISILGLLGLIWLIRKKGPYIPLFLAFFILPFIYIGSIAVMSKHFVFALFIFTPMAAYFLDMLHQKIHKIRLRYLLIAVLIIAMVMFGYNKFTIGNYYATSAMEQVMAYKSQIPANSLVLADARIYRGQINWIFNGESYLEASIFPDLYKASEDSPGEKVPMGVYFVECDRDDCGWGTVINQPEFNQSMESMAEFFRNQTEVSETFYSAEESPYYFPGQEQKPHFSVYKRTLLLNPGVLGYVKKTHSWFLYPVGYDKTIGSIFDDYNTDSIFKWTLNSLGLLIIRIGLILAFLSIIYISYLFLNQSIKD
mgnify:CR=1 FL=1